MSKEDNNWKKTLRKGKQKIPPRICIYGSHGIGKSTLASEFPSPIFISTEDGLDSLDVVSFPKATTIIDVVDSIKTLIKEEHEFKTVVVDTVDWLIEPLIQKSVEDSHDAKELAYGKGQMMVAEEFREILQGLDHLRHKKNMNVVLVAHASVTKFEDPRTEPYDRYQPKLPNRCNALLQEWTDVLAFCEDKIVKILANKDALYNADGNANLTASNAVLGQAIIPPTFGEFGIGLNPESFASYTYRCYFADKPRGKVLRLSMDGVTEISSYGMDDYFKDKLANSDSIIGYYDDSKDLYNVTFKSNAIRDFDDTVSFMEQVQGWPSRKSFQPEDGVSLNNIFYTFKNGDMWSHNNSKRNRFYDTSAGENDATKYYDSTIKFIFNDGPDTVKGFNTLNYEGTQTKVIQNLTDSEYFNNVAKNGWYAKSIVTDLQDGSVYQFKGKENKWFGNIQGTETTWNNSSQSGNLDTKEFSVQGIGKLSAAPTGDTAPTKVTITITENADGS